MKNNKKLTSDARRMIKSILKNMHINFSDPYILIRPNLLISFNSCLSNILIKPIKSYINFSYDFILIWCYCTILLSHVLLDIFGIAINIFNILAAPAKNLLDILTEDAIKLVRRANNFRLKSIIITEICKLLKNNRIKGLLQYNKNTITSFIIENKSYIANYFIPPQINNNEIQDVALELILENSGMIIDDLDNEAFENNIKELILAPDLSSRIAMLSKLIDSSTVFKAKLKDEHNLSLRNNIAIFITSFAELRENQEIISRTISQILPVIVDDLRDNMFTIKLQELVAANPQDQNYIITKLLALFDNSNSLKNKLKEDSTFKKSIANTLETVIECNKYLVSGNDLIELMLSYNKELQVILTSTGKRYTSIFVIAKNVVAVMSCFIYLKLKNNYLEIITAISLFCIFKFTLFYIAKASIFSLPITTVLMLVVIVLNNKVTTKSNYISMLCKSISALISVLSGLFYGALTSFKTPVTPTNSLSIGSGNTNSPEQDNTVTSLNNHAYINYNPSPRNI